ncbi:hypothetical protein [Comamonas sp.]|uniref:hypothetical protein n=1 Tax=Comamonas sp. TaxID=34028 RepID=UPI003A954FA6
MEDDKRLEAGAFQVVWDKSAPSMASLSWTGFDGVFRLDFHPKEIKPEQSSYIKKLEG